MKSRLSEERLVTIKEACALVGFSRAHLDRFESDPEYEKFGFPKRVKIGYKRLYVWTELQDWISLQILNRSNA